MAQRQGLREVVQQKSDEFGVQFHAGEAGEVIAGTPNAPRPLIGAGRKQGVKDIGYRNQFLTDTHGEGIINQIFDGYDVWAGMIANRSTGSLVSFETGEAVTYGLFNAQQRGTLLVGAGEKVYEGMVIGYTASGEDVDVNVCKTKHLTNTRASGSDDALRLIPISKLSLEGCLEFLAQDELLEVTPENLRIRKQILNHEQRMKAKSKLK